MQRPVTHIDALVGSDAETKALLASAAALAKRYNGAAYKTLVEVAFLHDATSATDGSVLVFTESARTSPVLDAVRLGDGVTWVRVAEVAQADVDAAMARLPTTLAVDPSARFKLERGYASATLDDVYYLSVRGGDSAALAAFRADTPEDATFDDFRPNGGRLDDAYATLCAAASARRRADLHVAATALGLTILDEDGGGGGGGGGEHATVSVSRATAYPKPAERPDAVFYTLYARAVDPSVADDGVLVTAGPMGGSLLYEGDLRKDGQLTCAFDTSRFGAAANRAARAYSVWPASTGVAAAPTAAVAAGRTLAPYADMNESMRTKFATRVRWGGPVRAYNDAAMAAYYAHYDVGVQATLETLGAPRKPPVALGVMATYMPGLDPLVMTMPQLGEVARRTRALREATGDAGDDVPTLPVPLTTLFAALREDAVHTRVDLASLFSGAHPGNRVMSVPMDVLEVMASAASSSSLL